MLPSDDVAAEMAAAAGDSVEERWILDGFVVVRRLLMVKPCAPRLALSPSN